MYPTACPKQKVSNGKRVHIFSRKKYCQLANCRFAEYNYYSSFCLSDNASYIVWSDINRIPPVHLHSLSMRRHISPSPFLKSPLYNFLPWHTLINSPKNILTNTAVIHVYPTKATSTSTTPQQVVFRGAGVPQNYPAPCARNSGRARE